MRSRSESPHPHHVPVRFPQATEPVPAHRYFNNSTAYCARKVANQYVGTPCRYKVFRYVTTIFFHSETTKPHAQCRHLGQETKRHHLRSQPPQTHEWRCEEPQHRCFNLLIHFYCSQRLLTWTANMLLKCKYLAVAQTQNWN